MKTIESIANTLEGKKVILRLDLNVPLQKENITDTNRIDKIHNKLIKIMLILDNR